MKKTLKTASAAAVLAAMFASPTFAQTTDATADANRDATANQADVIGDPEDDGFDHWGLLGLLGLAGLMKRPKQDVVVRQDYNQSNTPR